MNQDKLKGLYAITDSHLCPDREIRRQVEQAIIGGARVIQYRDKRADFTLRHHTARALLSLCREHRVPLIINDDLQLATAIGADGIHLGKDDCTLEQARERLGHGAIIGISCYNRLELALEAQNRGASYAAFGRFFTSSTKPEAVQASPELLRQARDMLHIPIVAIGGITPENGKELVAAGADMLAVINGVFGQPRISQACQRLSSLFSTTEALSS